MISLDKWMILTPLQKFTKNVEDLGKLIVAKCFEKLSKSNKLLNLVTLPTGSIITTILTILLAVLLM